MSTAPAPAGDAPVGRERTRRTDGFGAEFDALMAAAHSGFGGQVSVAAENLHHETELFSEAGSDSHAERLEQMTSEARAAVGRQSRLDSGPALDSTGLGPRGHRLALERQDLGRQVRPANADATADGKGSPAPPTGRGETASVAQPVEARAGQGQKPPVADVSGERATGHKVAPNAATPTATARSDTALSLPRTSEATPLPVPVQGAGEVGAVRLPGQPDSAAQLIARLLLARTGGAVSSVEQSGSARAAVNPPQAGTTGARPGKANAARPPSASTARPQAPEPAQRSVFDRLMRSLRLNVGRQGSTARLHLRPPELGRIRIDARMEGQRLEVLVQTETRAARELLQARGADLQAALEQHGIKVDRFEFSTAMPDDRPDSTGWFAQAGDPDAGRSAVRQDAEQSAGHHGSARDDIGDQTTGPVEVEGTESTIGAAAETRLDVRV